MITDLSGAPRPTGDIACKNQPVINGFRLQFSICTVEYKDYIDSLTSVDVQLLNGFTRFLNLTHNDPDRLPRAPQSLAATYHEASMIVKPVGLEAVGIVDASRELLQVQLQVAAAQGHHQRGGQGQHIPPHGHGLESCTLHCIR